MAKSKNKIMDKMEELGYGPISKTKMETLYKLISIRYVQQKENALQQALTQIAEYMNTIKSQQDTIQFQQNTIKNFQDANEIYYDRIVEWRDLVKAKHDENVKVWQQRNEAIRSYNGLVELGKTAEELGVDTSEWTLPEDEKEKMKDFKFSVDSKVLESGKTIYSAKLTKREKIIWTMHLRKERTKSSLKSKSKKMKSC